MPEQYYPEEQQQQVVEQQPQPYQHPNLPSPPEDDFFRYRIDGADILEQIEHQLKGEVFDAQQNKYIPKFDVWINDEGINKVLHVIYTCGINKNTFLGNLTKEEIMNETGFHGKAITGPLSSSTQVQKNKIDWIIRRRPDKRWELNEQHKSKIMQTLKTYGL